jgi:ligand-binding sensor domain-containing protein
VSVQVGGAALAALLSTVPAHARVLPFETVALREGLPLSQITSVVRDSRRYLWAADRGGLARFKGDDFTPGFVGDGLPSNRVHELLLDTAGTVRVATAAGIAVL